jgi:hypothetical protein
MKTRLLLDTLIIVAVLRAFGLHTSVPVVAPVCVVWTVYSILRLGQHRRAEGEALKDKNAALETLVTSIQEMAEALTRRHEEIWRRRSVQVEAADDLAGVPTASVSKQ